jgi:hypothetical protein
MLILVALAVAGCTDSPLPPPTAPGVNILCVEPCQKVVDAGDMRAFEPAVASNPRDSRHLVAVSNDFTGPGYADRWIYTHVSRDGGITWTKIRIPGGRQDPQTPLAACMWMFDPIVTILEDGTVLVGGIAAGHPYPGPFSGGSYRLNFFIARSTDGGNTFPQVSLPGEAPHAPLLVPTGARRPSNARSPPSSTPATSPLSRIATAVSTCLG